MNIQQFKTFAVVFLAGGAFFYIDHYHKSILNHGYSLAILAGTIYLMCWLQSKANKNNNERTIIYRDAPPPAVGYDATEQHTLNVGQKAKVRG
jgi:hypothetical protein